MSSPSLAFVWTEINNYAASCIRTLIHKRRHRVKLWAGAVGTTNCYNGMSQALDSGNLVNIINSKDSHAIGDLISEIEHYAPEILFLGGWSQSWCHAIIKSSNLKKTKIVLMVDNPWRGGLRQRIAPIALRSFVKRCSAVLVPGERAWQFARQIGFNEGRIFKGLYGVDSTLLKHSWNIRSENAWPRSFIFVGQLIERKGVDILCQGYKHYREMSSERWPILLAGDGPLRRLVEDIEGFQVLGFLQPQTLANSLANSGCFILPSRYDAWPLALVEACIAGLPIVCTTACGSAVENVRDWYNGRLIEPGNPDAIARALLWMENHYSLLPQFGSRSRELASPYTNDEWSSRIAEISDIIYDS